MTVGAKWVDCQVCGCTMVLVPVDYEWPVTCTECEVERALRERSERERAG